MDHLDDIAAGTGGFDAWEHVCSVRSQSTGGASDTSCTSQEDFAPKHATERSMGMPSMERSVSTLPDATPFDVICNKSTSLFDSASFSHGEESVYRSIAVVSAAPDYAVHRTAVAASLEKHGSWNVCERVESFFFEQAKLISHFSPCTSASDGKTTSPRASPFPFHISPYTSAKCRGSLKELINAINGHFEKGGIDVDFDPNGCVWKTKSYPRQHCLATTVSIYETEDDVLDNSFIVQVQKRKGCGFEFASFFKHLKSTLCKGKFIDTPSPVESECEAPAMRRKRVASNEEVIDFRPIVDMARSPYADVQEEALLFIAAEASKPCPFTLSVLATTPRLIETIIALLGSPLVEIHRLAASALCNLCKFNENTKACISNQGGIARLISLGERDGLCRETKRQVAGALREMKYLADMHVQDRIDAFIHVAH